MRHARTCLLLPVLLALHFQPAGAQIQVVGQDRRASTSVLVNGDGESDFDQTSEVAPDSGPFDVSLSMDAVIAIASASAHADQSSAIAAQSIRAAGAATGEAQVSGSATAYAFAQSNVAVRFTLDVAVEYTLHGFVDASSETATATLQLARPFQTIAWYSGDGGRTDLHQQGMLEPGTYDLNVTCSGGASISPGSPDEQGSGSYDIVFVLGQATGVPLAMVEREALRAFPNPFRAVTRVSLPDGVGQVQVLDARGRRVRTLEGIGEVLFDGTDAAGQPLTAGVYWLKALGERDVDAVKVVRLQ